MLQRLHAPLSVTEEAFSEMGALLRETLEDFGLAEADIQHVVHEIVSRKHFIVAR
jgi:hemoglobin